MQIIWLGIHVIGVIIAFGLLFSVMSKQNLEYKTWLLMTIVCCLMALTAKSCFIVAEDFRELVVLAKMEYMGKCFANYYAILFILQYRKIEWPKWITRGMLGINFVMFCIIMTCDYHTLYYKSMGMKQTDMGYLLVLEKAPLYYFYMAFILLELTLYLILSIDLLVRFWKEKEYLKLHIILVVAGAVPFLFLFLHVIGATSGQDMVPIGILVATVLFVGAVNHYGLFDLVRNAKDSVVENIEEGIFVTDQYMNVLYANPAAIRLWQDVQGDLHGELKQRISDEIQKIYERSGTILEWNGKKYEVRGMEIGGSSLKKGYLISMIDVTGVMRQAEIMKELKEEAEEANRAKSLFLAKMSHEIRTPINAVLNMNEVILRESREENIKEYAMDVKSSARTLLGIINDILDLSKIESGNMEIVAVEYEMSSLINDVVNMIYTRAKEKGLDFQVIISPSLPSVLLGDDVRIRQILVNLLTNAVKYTETGTVSFVVNGKIVGEEVKLHFAVRDTGIGIKKEDMPKLYEAFQRIQEVENHYIEGTGLGISITVQLLNMMDSNLQVESIYGKGSTFSFDLVQKIVKEDEIGDFQERIHQLTTAEAHQNLFFAPEAKLLVVDDCDMNRKVFRSLLKETQIQITDVESGAACLEQVKECHYDIIFLDHMMPELDGIETLRQLKTMEENKCKDTPVIMLTANAISGAKELYLKEGFDDFLSKPIVPEKMERMICEYLPKELIQEMPPQEMHTQEETQEEIQELPDIAGINWEYAKLYFPDQAILRQTAEEFYLSMDREKENLQMLYELRHEPSDLKQYQIKVHAMKSSSAMIGAMMLSTVAALIEEACIGQNISRIEELHPILLEQLQKYKQNMAVLHQESEKPKKAVDITQILSLLDRLGNSLNETDLDMADECMEQLCEYQYEEEAQKIINQLQLAVMNFETQKAKAEIQKMLICILGGN